MTTWKCEGCGVEHTDSDVRPPENGCVFTSEVVSMEERGDLGPHGTWTTLAELAAQPHQTEHVDHGRGVHSLRRVPRFAIGHRTFVVQTSHGNLLWDAPGYLDDDIVSLVPTERCSSVTPSPVGWPATGCRSSANFPRHVPLSPAVVRRIVDR